MTRTLSLIALVALFTLVCGGDRLAPADDNQPVVGAQVQVDASKAGRTYANFSRVTGTPEELIVDFGLNMTPIGIPKDPIVIDQQIVMNYYTAKRLVGALQLAVERHEQAFGPIETDVRKRVIQNR